MSVAVAMKARTLRTSDATQPKERHLELVPQVRRRYAGMVGVVVALAAVLLVVVVGRAYMAEQQMQLDRLNSDVRRAREYFDELRARRAELQSPENLVAVAWKAGLVPSVGNKVVTIPAEVAATVAATVGKIDADIADGVESPLDEFGRVKATVDGTP